MKHSAGLAQRHLAIQDQIRLSTAALDQLSILQEDGVSALLELVRHATVQGSQCKLASASEKTILNHSLVAVLSRWRRPSNSKRSCARRLACVEYVDELKQCRLCRLSYHVPSRLYQI